MQDECMCDVAWSLDFLRGTTAPADMSALYARAVRNVADVKALCGDAVAGAGSLERDESLIEVLSAKEASFAAHKSFHAGCFFASSAKVCTCMLPLGVGENCE
jgi:hypothetical protein